jgi:transposase
MNSDEEWAVIAPLLPNKSRGIERVDDRRVINGTLWRFRTGSSWRDVPDRYGPRTTLYNRFIRWRKAGVWDRLLDAVSKRYDGDIVMIDSSCVLSKATRRSNAGARRSIGARLAVSLRSVWEGDGNELDRTMEVDRAAF